MDNIIIKSTAPSSIVREYYSDPDIIKRYVCVGLWPSEEKVVDMFFKPGSTILDLGCGAGRTSIALACKGYQVTGVDLIPGMIDEARAQAEVLQTKALFVVMDVTNMRFPREYFDNAFFSFNGYEQIPGKRNREKVVLDVYKFLKPGGYFILTARSGIAFGRRMFGWAYIVLLFLMNKMFLRNAAELDFGDKIKNNEYHHYMSPFYIRKTAHNVGFGIVYFNSHENILRGRNNSFWTNFSPGKSLFFILKKPGN